MLPDEPTDEERQEELPQDNETPFRPADPNPDPAAGVTNDPVAQAASDSTLDDTHPVTDTNVQPEEQYDEGVSGAAEAQEPNAGNAVTGFAPPANGTNDTPAPTSGPVDENGDQPPVGSDNDNVVVG